MSGESPIRAARVQATVSTAGAPPPLRGLPALRRALTVPRGSAWRDPIIVVIAAVAFGAYFVISLFRLLPLTPSAVDLGTFTEFERQLSQFHAPITDLVAPGMNIEGDHFQVALNSPPWRPARTRSGSGTRATRSRSTSSSTAWTAATPRRSQTSLSSSRPITARTATCRSSPETTSTSTAAVDPGRAR